MNYEEGILNHLVNQATRNFKGYTVAPYWLSVGENPVQVLRPEILPEIGAVGPWDYLDNAAHIDLGNETLILTSNELDIPITATITLESLDNIFKATKTEYAAMKFNKNQVFTGFLKISVRNYGSYVPFNLEFLKITPKI
jgi:hypothetical protein